jgi:hypothetical protein
MIGRDDRAIGARGGRDDCSNTTYDRLGVAGETTTGSEGDIPRLQLPDDSLLACQVYTVLGALCSVLTGSPF